MDEVDLMHDFTLMLIYLTSWDEKAGQKTVAKAWRTYDDHVLASLERDGLITSKKKSSPLVLTEDGESMARTLVNVYGSLINDFQRQVAENLETSRLRSDEPAFRFRIDLKLGGHTCWREVVVPQDMTFADLHDVIQASCLWWDYHLFDFQLTSKREKLMLVDPDAGGVDSMLGHDDVRRVVDANGVNLLDVFPRTRTATYTYDYGDWWVHKIKLVETIPCYKGDMPACTAGVGDAPPEDVGGTRGFEHFLEAIADPKDPDHYETCAWGYSQFFERFSLDAVNARIRKWRTGALFDEWDRRQAEELDDPDGPDGSDGPAAPRGGAANLRLVP